MARALVIHPAGLGIWVRKVGESAQKQGLPRRGSAGEPSSSVRKADTVRQGQWHTWLGLRQPQWKVKGLCGKTGVNEPGARRTLS